MNQIYQQENLKKYKKFILPIVIAYAFILVIVLTYWYREDQKADRKNLNEDFAGSIQSIYYNIKQFPTITIGDKSYHIGPGYNTDHQIEVGDSIIKRKGSDVYVLIKHNTHKTIKLTK